MLCVDGCSCSCLLGLLADLTVQSDCGLWIGGGGIDRVGGERFVDAMKAAADDPTMHTASTVDVACQGGSSPSKQPQRMPLVASLLCKQTAGSSDIAEKGGGEMKFCAHRRKANCCSVIEASWRLGLFRGAEGGLRALRRSKSDRSARLQEIRLIVARCRAGSTACVASPELDQTGGGGAQTIVCMLRACCATRSAAARRAEVLSLHHPLFRSATSAIARCVCLDAFLPRKRRVRRPASFAPMRMFAGHGPPRTEQQTQTGCSTLLRAFPRVA